MLQISSNTTLCYDILKFIINSAHIRYLRVTSSYRDHKFLGPDTAKIDGFFQEVKQHPEGSLKNFKPDKISIRAKSNSPCKVLVIPYFLPICI